MTSTNLPHSTSEKGDQLRYFFSLLGSDGDGIWVDSKGLSMLPIFYKGVRVHITPELGELKIGHIVVFYRSNKFIAHRIVDYDPQTNFYATKGDTLFYFDAPSSRKDFLGLVDKIEKRGKSSLVGIDPATAKLSSKLGNTLVNTLRFLPGWLKFLYYFFFFIPGYIRICLQKKSGHQPG